MAYKLKQSGDYRERRNFSMIKNSLELDNLLQIQKESYQWFVNEGIKEEIDKHNLNLIGVVPMDEMIYEYDSSGIPLVNLPEDSKAKIAINDIMAKLELN